MAITPISCLGWEIVVSGGLVNEARRTSSKPTTTTTSTTISSTTSTTTTTLIDSVTRMVGPGGTVTTDGGGTGATPDDPVETYVTTPNAATITIHIELIPKIRCKLIERYFGEGMILQVIV